MTYIKLFLDYLDAIEPLGDAERGRLFTALMQYARTGEAPQLCGNERFLFPMMRAQIDRDEAAAECLSESRSEAGKKGAKAKASKAKQNNQMPDLLSKSSYDKDKEEDNDKEEDMHPPIPPQGGQRAASLPKYHPDWFERFWALYPRKTNRVQAVKAWDKLKPDLPLCNVMADAIRAQMQSQQWQDAQHIPHPSTWLNGERWNDEIGGGKGPYGYDPGDTEGWSL